MIIALDIGHMGKKSSPADRGAVNDRYREADLVFKYTMVAWQTLEDKGHTVFILCYDNYIKRKEFCDLVKADVHVQCHLNSPAGRYALLKYRDDGHVNNAHLCQTISRKLQEHFGPVISKVEVKVMVKDDPESRGYDSLKSNIPSILFEPLFIQNEEHLKFMVEGNGLSATGIALATAIDEWGKSRGN